MFKTWCKEQGFWNNTNVSHVLMDGGVLSVPFDRLNDFYIKYTDSYNSGEKIFVVEQKTENYNFFVDIDYKDEDEIEFSELENYCKIICERVKKLGGKEALISVAQPKKVGHLVKTGIHINWPDFIVNQSSALAIREILVRIMNEYYGSRNWNDIIDEAVYGSLKRKAKGSGFRMPWSHKKGKHDECSGKGCAECNYTGKVTQSEYKPIFIYRYGPFQLLETIDGQVADVKIMNMATLRTERDDPVIIESKYSKKSEGSFTTAQIKNEFKDQEAISLVEEFVRKNLEGQNLSRITKIYENKNQFLVSTNSFYCENKKCNHNSNHVWFHILGDTIAQKCFSTTDTMRHFGFCKDFTGKRHQLSSKITNILYKDGKVEKYKPKNSVKKNEPVGFEQAIELLNLFINKNVFKNKNLKIQNIETKNTKKHIVLTSYSCEKCISNVNFEIENKLLIQKCKCKSPPKHILTNKILQSL